MTRELLTERALLAALNLELAKDQICNDCHFSRILRSKDVDSTGCNRFDASLTCTGATGKHCYPTSSIVIAWAQGKYNLAD